MPANIVSFAKFGQARRRRYLNALREGSSKTSAAAAAGVSYEMVRLYRKHSPFFADDELGAELYAVGNVEDSLYQTSVSGNVPAIKYYLNNRAPDRWQEDRHVHLSGQVAVDVTEARQAIDAAAIDDRARELLLELAERVHRPPALPAPDDIPDAEIEHPQVDVEAAKLPVEANGSAKPSRKSKKSRKSKPVG
jgi:hypothetical protein